MNVLEKIIENHARKDSGLSNNIPFPFSKMEDLIPGVEREQYTLITGGTGTGKTKMTKKLYVFTPIEYILKTEKTDLKIFYFALEESRDRFILSIYSYFLWKKYNVSRSVNELLSIGNTRLSIDELKIIEDITPFIEEVLSYIDIVTSVRNPTGIYLYVKDWVEKEGDITYREITIKGKKIKARVSYKPHHEDKYVVVVVDHLSLLQPEEGAPTLHQAMSKLSSVYFLDLRDMYKCTVVGVQQQAAAMESVDNFKYEKIEPSLNGLGDNKLTSRDANKVYGVFMPYRYDIKIYRGEKVRQDLICFSVIKNREGLSNLHLLLNFNGRVGSYKQLK
tara:strand:+ start:5877 stop:6878 length:1002 start_codon:yes stop_codon:yes gene_type:complete